VTEVREASGRPKSYPRWLGVVVALMLSMLVAVVLLTLEPLEPLPASAPTNEFSAERAFSHVDRIARRPHPVGSEANTEVRKYLLRQLEDLGLRPTAKATTAAQTHPDGTYSLARVHNIHARIEGTDSTGHVVLVAHYDSVLNAPGAADDGAGVAAILEITRVLTSGSPPRNDVDVVLTDAEEPGLLGAQAFVDAGLLDPRRSVVLNLEARGTSGPAIMFETNPDNTNVVPALASAQRPIAGSETAAIYRLLPNDTDFTVFRRDGFAGMNFAFVDGSAHYHTPGDSPSNLDPSSLQHMGATVLDAARYFARQDLDAPRGGPLTYSSLLGQLLYYPQGLAVPLGVLAAVAFAATVLHARRRGLRAHAVAVAAVGFLALLVVTGGLGVAAWQALLLLRPGYGSFLSGDTYRPEWYAAGALALTASLTFAWYLLLRRRYTPEEIGLGMWGWLVVLALLTAVFIPGTAYLFTWPPLAGSFALAAAVRWGGTDPTWRWLAYCAAAVPAIALLLPSVDFSTGLSFAAFPMIVAVLVLASALPVLDLLAPRRAYLVPVAVTVVGLALFAAGLRIDSFDDEHPRQTSLVYALDADRGQAMWISSDPTPAPWTDRYVDAERTEADDRFPGSPIFSFPPSYHTGAASEAQLKPPDVTVTQSRQDGDTRDLELRVAPGGASRLALYADSRAHTLVTATVDGVRVDEAGGQTQGTGPPKWGFVFHATPPEGIDVMLRVRGEGPLPLRVVAYRRGLPQVPELTPVPDDLRWSAASSNLTVIAKTYHV
jgi:Peptidase family M28